MIFPLGSVLILGKRNESLLNFFYLFIFFSRQQYCHGVRLNSFKTKTFYELYKFYWLLGWCRKGGGFSKMDPISDRCGTRNERLTFLRTPLLSTAAMCPRCVVGRSFKIELCRLFSIYRICGYRIFERQMSMRFFHQANR